MPEPVGAVLLAITYLLAKHAVADFGIQTRYQHANKGRYGHLGGLLHAGTHAVFSIPMFLILPVSLATALMIIIGEAVVHYHIDWAKENITRAAGWTHTDMAFWQAIGLDQFLHGLTYVAMITVAVSAAG